MKGTVEFSSDPGGTKVTYLFTMQPSGLLALLEPLIEFAFAPRFRQNLEKLASLLENRSSNPS